MKDAIEHNQANRDNVDIDYFDNKITNKNAADTPTDQQRSLSAAPPQGVRPNRVGRQSQDGPVISHQHRCIFIHIPKTGGTSIENVIWPRVDLRTPDDLWMGFTGRFNNKYQTGGLQHLLATHVRSEVGMDVFQSYFTFTIVRNPWDRAVSQYAYMKQRDDLRDFLGMSVDAPFKQYLHLIGGKKHVQWEEQVAFVHDSDGTALVDYVGRFETLKESAGEIFGRVGIRGAQLPHELRGERGPYQDFYDEESIEMVASMYAADIAAFGYSFDNG